LAEESVVVNSLRWNFPGGDFEHDNVITMALKVMQIFLQNRAEKSNKPIESKSTPCNCHTATQNIQRKGGSGVHFPPAI
jgi:hypothetical protein